MNFDKIVYQPLEFDGYYGGYFFYKKDTLKFSFKIDNVQRCCENFGINLYHNGTIYHNSDTPSHVLNDKNEIVWSQDSKPVTVVRWAYDKDLPKITECMFEAGIVIEFDDKTWMSVVAWNNHSGPYPHDIIFTLDGKEDEQTL